MDQRPDFSQPDIPYAPSTTPGQPPTPPVSQDRAPNAVPYQATPAPAERAQPYAPLYQRPDQSAVSPSGRKVGSVLQIIGIIMFALPFITMGLTFANVGGLMGGDPSGFLQGFGATGLAFAAAGVGFVLLFIGGILKGRS